MSNWHIKRTYCLLLKRMQLACTAWAKSLNTRQDGRRKNKQILSKTWTSITPRLSLQWLPYVKRFVCKPKVILMNISDHSQHTRQQLHYLTRIQHGCTLVYCASNWNSSITGYKGESALPVTNICQCQPQTPLSVISTLQGKADYAGNVEKVKKTVLRSTARNVDIM